MSVILPLIGGNLGGAWTPAFEQSVICDGGASMTRTFTSTSGDSWAIALRRSRFGATQNVISSTVYFDSSDRLVAFGRTSTRVFRDIGWYVFLFNPTSMYVNGPSGMDEVTGTGTYAMASIANPVLCGTANRFEGALAGFWHGDSVAWSVSDFVGSFTFDGQGLPIALSPSLTYGADGVRLLFADTSNFGDDTSGNGNDWTPTGFVAGDQTADVPGRPYAVLNPLDKVGSPTFSDGGLAATMANGTAVASSLSMTSGKYYCEFVATFSGNTNAYYGVVRQGTLTTNPESVSISSLQAGGWYDGAGNYTASGAATFASGDTLGLTWDADAGTLTIRVNDVEEWSYTRASWAGVPVQFVHTAAIVTGGSSTSANFGQRAFAYTPPTGFLPLHTGNLPTPSAPANPDTGSVTANGSADGPSVYLGYAPSASDTLTLGGSAVTWGTHADRLSYGFKVRTASAPYNDGSGSKAYSLVTTNAQYGGGDAPWPLAR